MNSVIVTRLTESYEHLREVVSPIGAPVYAPLIEIASQLGVAKEDVIFFAVVIVSFASCLAVGQMKSVLGRKIFSVVVGLATGFTFYGLAYIFNIALILTCYCCLLALPRKQGAKLLTLVAVLGCGSASVYHLHYSQLSEGWDIDIIFMINFVKLHMIAVNYENAAYLD